MAMRKVGPFVSQLLRPGDGHWGSRAVRAPTWAGGSTHEGTHGRNPRVDRYSHGVGVAADHELPGGGAFRLQRCPAVPAVLCELSRNTRFRRRPGRVVAQEHGPGPDSDYQASRRNLPGRPSPAHHRRAGRAAAAWDTRDARMGLRISQRWGIRRIRTPIGRRVDRTLARLPALDTEPIIGAATDRLPRRDGGSVTCGGWSQRFGGRLNGAVGE